MTSLQSKASLALILVATSETSIYERSRRSCKRAQQPRGLFHYLTSSDLTHPTYSG